MQLDRRYRWFKANLLGPDRTRKDYIFRGMTSGELTIAGSKSGEFEAESFILSQCVLNYEEDKEWAGTAKALYDLIINISGIDSEARTLQEAQRWMHHEEGKYEAVAISMIPSCTPEIMRNCDPSDRAKYLLLGKFMFTSIYGKEVEELFGEQAPTPNNMDDAFFTNPEVPNPAKGEKVTFVESGFNWKKTG